MCLVSTYLVGMNLYRNVDKMSLTSKNSDEAMMKNRMLLAIQ